MKILSDLPSSEKWNHLRHVFTDFLKSKASEKNLSSILTEDKKHTEKYQFHDPVLKFEVDIEKVTGVETVISEDVNVQLQQIIVESATKRLVFSKGSHRKLKH